MKLADNKAQKSLLRRKMLGQRQRLTTDQVKIWSQQVSQCMLKDPLFQQARTIMGYASFRNEVDLSPLLGRSLMQGKQLLLPVTDWEKQQILPVAVERYPADLRPGRYGILEPARDQKLWPLEAIDLVLVPGVAFDFQGYRLGYGRGFYDRFLTQLPRHTKIVGVAFNFQLVPTVFPEKHDVPLPVIITERGMINRLGSRRI